MVITKESIAPARQAGVGLTAVSSRYRRATEKLEVEYDNGVLVIIPVALIEGLAGASAADLSRIEITPSGWGLHFPRLDADIYVPALFEGIYGSGAGIKQAGRYAGGAPCER